jgi:hypothetical protein
MRLLLAVLALTISTPAIAQPSDFVNGDFYYTTTSYPQTGGGSTSAVVHFDQSTLAHTAINETLGVTGRGSFDSYRAKLLIVTYTIPLLAVDALGNATTLIDAGESPVTLVSAGIDGRVYFIGNNKFYYLDAADNQLPLMDITGTTQLTHFIVSQIFFDPIGNSLYVADISAAGLVTITRYDLSLDGSQVVGQTSMTINIGSSSVIATGMNHGPGDTIYIQIDDNSNGTYPRMQLLDKVTMTASTFATSGGRIVGGDIAGLYSNIWGKAFVTESLNNNLHQYSLGESGTGTIVASGISAGGSGEFAQYMEVLGYNPCPTDLDNDGDTDGADLGLFLAAWGPGSGPTDLDNDGDTDGADLGLFLAAWGACV